MKLVYGVRDLGYKQYPVCMNTKVLIASAATGTVRAAILAICCFDDQRVSCCTVTFKRGYTARFAARTLKTMYRPLRIKTNAITPALRWMY